MPLHIPVMPTEVLEWLAPAPGKLLADGTLGGGGHTRLLAERVAPNGRVIAVDRDPAAVSAAETLLAGLPVSVAVASYVELANVLEEAGIGPLDGILLDLGLSSDQLADDTRGFSFHSDGELDLRFDPTDGEPASRLVNRLSAETLADLIFNYGEERLQSADCPADRRRAAANAHHHGPPASRDCPSGGASKLRFPD